jgi:hypothetical protein
VFKSSGVGGAVMTGWGVMGVGEGINLGMEGYVVWSGLRVGDGLR